MLAVVFFTATSDTVYKYTAPAWLPHHTMLRKAYAIIAFAIAAAIVAPLFSPRARVLKVTVAITLLSAGIEIAQRLLGSAEWWRWVLFDVASGTLGGLLGALTYEKIARIRQTKLPAFRIFRRRLTDGPARAKRRSHRQSR